MAGKLAEGTGAAAEQARTLEGPLRPLLNYAIPFTKREEFESAWPHLLKVKSPGAPIVCARSELLAGARRTRGFASTRRRPAKNRSRTAKTVGRTGKRRSTSN